MDEEFEDFVDFEESSQLELAQLALDHGDDKAAIDLAEEYLERHPLNIDALNICAVAATNLQDYAKAMALYRTALTYDPKNGAIHHNFGVLLEKLGVLDEALEHLDRSLELQPDFPEAYINRGNILDELGRTEDALDMYDEALRRMPDAAEAYYNKGYALNRLARFDEAVESFEHALKANPADSASMNGMGYALSGLGRDAEAVSFYDRAIEKNPDMATCFYNRGLSHVRLHNPEKAIADFDVALQQDPEFGEALLEKATLLFDTDREAEAFSSLDAADRLAPENPEPPFYRALLHERQGDLQSALQELEISLKRDPDSLYTLNNKGNVLMDLGQLEEALVCFDAILQQKVRYPLAHYNRACVFARQRKVQETLNELDIVSRQDVRLLEDARKDPDFEWLHNNPSFQKLISQKKA